jgi:hypothetical protein
LQLSPNIFLETVYFEPYVDADFAHDLLTWGGQAHGSHIVTGVGCMDNGPTPSSAWNAVLSGHKAHGDMHCCAVCTLYEYARPSSFTHMGSNIQQAFCNKFWLVPRTDSVPGILAFNHVTLFSYSPMRPLRYTYCGQLLVCHACNRMVASNWPSSLVSLQKGFT